MNEHLSAQPCGCDPGMNWLCEQHAKAPYNLNAPLVILHRKSYPVWSGVLMYFPDAIKEVALVSKLGNDQHNPGEPLHWARGKSMDQLDAATRHMIDHGTGHVKDTDGGYHLAKAIWRLCAELQLVIEQERT